MPPPTANGRMELVPANVFVVRIPGIEIGYFHECSGLSIEVEVYEYAEGGNNEFVHQLPGRLHYPKLTLKRGLTTEDNLLKWFWATRTQAERKELYFEAQKLFIEDLPWVPLWSPVGVTAIRAELKNFKLGADGTFIWEDAFVES